MEKRRGSLTPKSRRASWLPGSQPTRTSTTAVTKPVLTKVGALLQFLKPSEWVLLCFSMACETGAGCGFPLMVLFFGEGVDSITSPCEDGDISTLLLDVFIKMAVLGSAAGVLRTLSTSGILYCQKKQIACFQAEYMRAVIRQDIGWYDVSNPQELEARFGDSLGIINKALGFQVWGSFPQNFGMLVSAAVIAFWAFPEVGAVGIAFLPVQALSMHLFTKSQAQGTKEVATAYAEAGGVASEALGSIKTVAYLGIEPYFVERYRKTLTRAMHAGVRQAVRQGASLGVLLGVEPLMYAVGYVIAALVMREDMVGNSFVVDMGRNGTYACTYKCSAYDARFLVNPPLTVPCDEVPGAYYWRATCRSACIPRLNETWLSSYWGYSSPSAYDAFVASVGGSESCSISAGKALTAIMCLNMIGTAIGGFPNALAQLTAARVVCDKVQQTLNRVPPIDSFSESGERPAEVHGAIDVRDVYFAYPSAPSLNVCHGYTLSIRAGEQCALSGPSGSGKSTIISLLERFYDPQSGTIELDGRDITTLNLGWLRQQLGYVGQEPVLFAGTVAENINYGKLNKASQQEIEDAAKIADAHTFISEVLSDGYNTQVGTGGARLSGGQKQRVAIARAMVKQPSIVLFDEATSALDSAAERAVQAALDQILASKKRTTLTIAHRLSTIRKAEQIAVVNRGVIIEHGTWEELMEQRGIFHELASKKEESSMQRASVTEGGGEEEAQQGEQSAETAVATPDQTNVSVSVEKGLPRAVRAFRISRDRSASQERSASKDGSNAKDTGGSGQTDGGAVRGEKLNLRKRMMALQDPGDGTLYVIGTLASLCTGGLKPATNLFAVFLLIALLQSSDPDLMLEETSFWSWVLAITSVLMISAVCVESYCFGSCGEHVIKNLRHRLMTKLMTMDIGFFDRDENSAGQLCMFLAEKASLVSALSGQSAAIVKLLLNALVTFVVIFIFAHWSFALVCIGFIPFNAFCFVMILMGMGLLPEGEEAAEQEEGGQAGEGKKSKPSQRTVLREAKKSTEGPVGNHKVKSEEKGGGKTAGQLVGEVVLGIRTLASFNAEKLFFSQYEASVRKAEAEALKGIPRDAGLAGLGWGCFIILFGAELLIGGNMANSGVFGDLSPGTDCRASDKAMLYLMAPILVLFGLIQTMGVMAAQLTGVVPAQMAAKALFLKMDHPSTPRDPSSTSGSTLSHIVGDICIDEVIFAYPTRIEWRICNRYSLQVKAGQICALCGPSGSGKSTIVNLIERFYDPLRGSITIDGHDLSTLNLKWLREQIGYVGQEPVLFDGTVAENIAMGAPEGTTETEVETAARLANAHDFITNSLNDGYQTQVGLRGGKLSGGQKQRVAIARALIRKPSIMLLDEATSALDNTSEKIVQAALDEIMVKNKKTTFTIAHRLSTIRQADVIAVVSQGKIAEKGNHEELMLRKGLYASLVQAQAGH